MKNSTARLLGFLVAGAVSASAGNLWVSDSSSLYLVDSSNLNVLSTVTLDYGSGSSSQMYSLAFDSSNGQLYANASGTLESIDPLSGVVTTLGSSTLNPSVQLAFDGVGNLYGLDSDNSQFLSIALNGDVSTLNGTNARLSGLAYDAVAGVFESLNFDGSGSLSVAQVDPLTGDSSGLFSASSPFNNQVQTFTVDETEEIFGVCGSGGSGSGGRSTHDCADSLFSIDPTGAVNVLGDELGNGQDVLAAAPSFAPEPSAVVLFLSGGIGLFALRKKLF